ncbi:bifunctional metallophosphatase/5'-nucleotidase [Lactobacillus sp. PV037]|uniref:bifunctional metallophosphatase/5'-nucleotidase n=1 Tax=Lactobacillus sp. PV037 TaxID=2594496 RepID=UPI00223FF922|nr:bifunctional UDP-sugar hydrolase/5'-nucleotidase [Lactobacillus sp. PV037]QNQ84036.1 bifunctional metallophosphatase/5'-nucleotidase [Lactobacillus sp. PV037]
MEKLRILHTNDLHSHFEQFPKIGRYLKQAQADTTVDQVLTFDAGDFMDRSHPLSDATEGQANIALMNEFNYDAITIGNNEGIANSHEVLENLFEDANFPVILANLREADEKLPKWANEYQIITTSKNTRIGLIGLTAPYPMTYEPNGWHVKFISQTLDNMLKKMANKYDFLIVISHIGLTLDKYIAEHYPQVKLIIGGHSHDLLAEGMKVNQTWITQTGKWGKYVGDILLEIENHQLKSVTPKTITVDDLPEHKGDREFVEKLRLSGEKLLAGRQIANLPKKFAQGQEVMIQAALNAVSEAAKTDIAMLNSGLFLTDVKPGVFTEADLQALLPHPMHVVRSKLIGRELWRLIMEMEKNRHFLQKFHQIGMSFRGKIFGNIVYKGIKVDPNSRTVYINGQEIEPEKEYVIAVLDHHVLVPFFPTLSIVGENNFLFPDYLKTVVAKYLSKNYPLKKRGEDSGENRK